MALLRGLFNFFQTESQGAPPGVEPRRMTVVLAGHAVSYALYRAKRRSVSMVITREGLIVRAPMKIALREIESILVERGPWIVEKLSEWQARTALVAADYRDGGSVLFRGKRLRIRVVPSLFEAFEVTDSEMLFASPVPLSVASQQDCVERWMRAQAQAEFGPIAHAMALHIGVDVKTVKLTDTRTMWGSCTADGVVRLTFRLIQLPPAIAQYVIAHEVAHRQELNHSPKFWEWVRVLDPHFKSHRRTLGKYTPLLEE
jgi:predicted metal-dependent hydrolase